MMQIEVQSSCGKSYNLEADPSSSVYDLQKRLAEKTGIYIGSQKLLSADDAPLKWNQTLSEANLHEQPKLRLHRKGSGVLNLKVRVYRRHEVEVTVDWDSKVINIKQEVFQHTRIPTSQQQLILDGRQLQDYEDMETAGLSDNQRIELKECSCLDCPYRNRFH